MTKKQLNVNANQLFLKLVDNKVILKEIRIPTTVINVPVNLADLTI